MVNPSPFDCNPMTRYISKTKIRGSQKETKINTDYEACLWKNITADKQKEPTYKKEEKKTNDQLSDQTREKKTPKAKKKQSIRS